MSPGGPVWWTRRSKPAPLNYHAMRAVLRRANDSLGTNWSLHDFRHTAAARMLADPAFTLVDVQTILRHASVTTTQIYTQPRLEDLVGKVLEHYARPPASGPTIEPGYDAAAVRELLGSRRREHRGRGHASPRTAAGCRDPGGGGPVDSAVVATRLAAPEPRCPRTPGSDRTGRLRIVAGLRRESAAPELPARPRAPRCSTAHVDELCEAVCSPITTRTRPQAAAGEWCAVPGDCCTWLTGYPGDTWEQRWLASGATPPRRRWMDHCDLPRLRPVVAHADSA